MPLILAPPKADSALTLATIANGLLDDIPETPGRRALADYIGEQVDLGAFELLKSLDAPEKPWISPMVVYSNEWYLPK
jgi:hypothetical protein